MSTQHARVIVNPVAGGHSTYREWPRISQCLIDKGLSFDSVCTEGIGHAIELAKAAANTDYRYIIAVGGDGTINEVANGILRSTGSHNTILGIVSAGSTCSFARSIGIPLDPVVSCSLLTSQNRLSIDVGIVEYESENQHLHRFFVNEAGVGFNAAVVYAWKHLPNRLGSNITHTLRTIEGLKSLFTYRNKKIKLHVGNNVETIYGCAVVVANGQYFADGMQIAPHAILDDGLLNIVTIGDVGKFELLKIWPTLYSGSHIIHHKIREEKAATVTIESDEQLLVEADGELLGEGPVSFSVLPSALSIVI
ncbi:diacylglycerol/lipid kinase family protein [Chloroflexota bacterium]